MTLPDPEMWAAYFAYNVQVCRHCGYTLHPGRGCWRKVRRFWLGRLWRRLRKDTTPCQNS